MEKLYSSAALLLMLAAAMPSSAQMRFPSQGNEAYQLISVVKQTSQLTSPSFKTLKPAPKAEANSDDFSGRRLYGNLIATSDWEGISISSVPYGIYSYDFGGDFQQVSTWEPMYNFSASAFGRDRLLGAFPMSFMGSFNGVRYMELDSAKFDRNWETVYADVDYGYVPYVMTYDPTSDRFYAVTYNAQLNGSNWAYFDENTRMFTTVTSFDNGYQPVTLGATPDGRIFSIGLDGNYYSIDKYTGKATKIASTGITPAPYTQAMGYDPRTATFVWNCVTTDADALYAVDVETGTPKLINSLSKNEHLSSLFFKGNEAKDKAPAAIKDMALSFTGTAQQSGNLTFTVPTEAYDGTSLSGDLAMTIYVDGEAETTATVKPGSRQTHEVALSNDNHYIAVTLENDAGYSPNNYVYQYVGYDTPMPVSNVSLSTDSASGEFQVTWTPPTEGIHNGFIDKDGLTYNIVRMPDNTSVATGIKDTVFTEPIPEALQRYSYRVTAVNGGKAGEYAESNDVLYGQAFEAPYSDDFSDESTLALYSTIDGNGDGQTWSFNSYNHSWIMNSASYGAKSPSNDWLVTPSIHLKPGMHYTLTYNIADGGSWRQTKEQFKILIGTSLTDTTSYSLIAQDDSFYVHGNYVDVANDFTVTAEGNYFFAIVCTSVYPGSSSLFVDKITVDELGVDGAPDAPTELTVTPDSDGAMAATVTFTAPVKTLEGKDLDGNLTANIYRDGGKLPIGIVNVKAGGQASYIDRTVKGVGNHTYAVSAANDKGEGKRATTTAFVGIYEPTYSNEFAAESDAEFFKTFRNGESVTGSDAWSWSSWRESLGLSYYASDVPVTIDLAFPAIRLHKDSVYNVAFKWSNSASETDNVKAEFGYSRTAVPTEFTSVAELPKTGYDSQVFSTELVTNEGGRYYPCIRITAESSTYLSMGLDSVVISPLGSAFAPGAVTELKAQAGDKGALNATVSFKAPAVDYAGNALAANMDVRVYRGSNSVNPAHTFTDVAPGSELSWTDESVRNGLSIYNVVAHNDYGTGRSASDTTFVGIDQPLGVENFTVKGSADNTGATLVWDAPTGGVHGGYIDNSLQYIVAEVFPYAEDSRDLLKVLSTQTETGYSVVNVETADSQAVHYYTIIPRTSGGYDLRYALIDQVVLGKPYELPFKESFAASQLTTSVWSAASTSEQAGWTISADDNNTQSQDGDNGMARFGNSDWYGTQAYGQLVSPKFALAEDSVYVEFYVYMGTSTYAEHAPYVSVSQNADDGDYVSLGDDIHTNEGETGWQKFTFTLPQTGNYGTLRFTGMASNYSDRVYIDNIVVTSKTADRIGNIVSGKSGIHGVMNGISFLGTKGVNYRIYTADGKVADKFTSTGNDIRTLAPGLYIVTDGTQTTKVAVK